MEKSGVKGFTLIEMMITVAIIAILAGIAVPSYQQHIVRSNRAAAQAAMMDIANLQQQFLLANRAYAMTTAALNYTLPNDVSAKYDATINATADNMLNATCDLATNANVPSFIVVMAPKTGGSQVADGTLYLSSAGTKCPSNKW